MATTARRREGPIGSQGALLDFCGLQLSSFLTSIDEVELQLLPTQHQQYLFSDTRYKTSIAAHDIDHILSTLPFNHIRLTAIGFNDQAQSFDAATASPL